MSVRQWTEKEQPTMHSFKIAALTALIAACDATTTPDPAPYYDGTDDVATEDSGTSDVTDTGCWNGVCEPGEEGKCAIDCEYCGNFRCREDERTSLSCPADCGGPNAEFCGDKTLVSVYPVTLALPSITPTRDANDLATQLGLVGEPAINLDGLGRALNENELQIELSNGRPVIVGLEGDDSGRVLIVYGFTGQMNDETAEYEILEPLAGKTVRASYHALTYGADTGYGFDLWSATLYRLAKTPIICP